MADLKTTNIFGDAYINNKVGIATNAPATRLQIGQLSPTAATEGLQFGDDTGARLYRGGSSYIQASAGFQAGAQIYASTYLQSGNSQMYPGSYTSTQRFGIGNASGNAWIDGLTIAQGGNVTVYNNLTVNGTLSAAGGSSFGTSFPQLTINGTTNTHTYLVINRTNYEGGIQFQTSGTVKWYNYMASGDDANIRWYANSATQMVLSNAGDLTATRYVSGTYVNTSDDVSTSNITYIMAKFGDNYHRSATAAKVAAFLSGQTMNIVGTAASETLGTVSGRGNNTSTQLIVSTAAGQAMYVGRQIGAGYSYGSAGIFTAISDNPNGGSNIFFQGYNSGSSNTPGGVLTYSIRADGQIYTTMNSATGIANNSFSVVKGVLGAIHIANGSGTSGNNNQAAITFQGDSASTAQAGIYVSNNSSTGTAMAFATTDNYTTGPQIFMSATSAGVVNFSRARPTYAGNALLDTSNNAYAANMNQYVRTTDSPTFAGATINGGTTVTGQLQVNNTANAASILRIYSGGSTAWSIGVGDSSGTNFNITADFGSVLINKSTGAISVSGSGFNNTVLLSNSTLTAGNLSGTIPSGVLGNSTVYIGTTGITLNRTSSALSLTGINIDGNSGGIYAAGNAYIQTTTTGTAYTSHIQVREAVGGGGNTNEIYAPALGFHWSGVVASNILMESSGRIAIRNNPGSGYENFIASEVFAASTGIGAYNFMKYGGTRSGDWQLFTTSSVGAGQMNVIQVENIGGGGHTNYPTGVYTYGGVMSWRLPNHSFQLYAAHTGDLAYKTQWNNDNYSGWRRILDSSNYPYAANMNQYVRTTDSPTFVDLFVSGLQIRTASPTITLRDTDHRTGFIHVNSNIFYILTGGVDVGSGNWGQVANSRWPLEINLSNNNATFGADVNAISFTGAGTGLTGTAASLTAGAVTNGFYTTGGQTIAGITYFSNGESINAYGIRGRFTNEYLHLYNKVGVGHSGGWGQGESSTPDKGLSTYGGLNIAYGDNGLSTFNGVIRANSNIRQGADLARPLSSWSVAGTSTGMVIFSFPGNTGNYGMVHCVFDIYEYNANTVSTVIVGGHNWNGAWYNFGANVIGKCGKSVRLGVKDSKFCVVFGGAASSWEYGTIILRKIHNGGFYTGIMDMGGSFTTQQTTTESFSNISGDLRALRTSADFIADGGVTGTSFSGAGTGLTGTASSLSIGGNAATATTLQTGRAINGVSFNGSAAITVDGLNYSVNNAWLRENGDDAQFQMYGNSRTMIYRTDGNTNPHGGGGYAHIFYYGGSADAQRMFIINTDGRLWSNYHGWLDAMSISGNAATATTAAACSGNAATVTNGIYTTSYYTGTPLGKRRYRIHSADSTSLNSSISSLECGFTYGGSGEPTGPFIAFGGLGGAIDYSCQLVGAYSGGGNDFKIRTRNDDSATWNTWRTIVTDGNYTDYTVTKTGTGASGTWGISISGNAATATSATSATTATTATNATVNSGNTSASWYPIVWHSGNTLYSTAGVTLYAGGSYIQTSYFNCSDNVDTGNITYIMAKFGDNYLRSATAAKVAAFITGQTMNINGSSTSCSGNAATCTTANAVAAGAIKAAGLDSSVEFTMTGLTSNSTIKIFPSYVSPYSSFLRMGYDNTGNYEYTIKRDGTTGFLEFYNTQANYTGYYFRINGSGGGLGIAVSPASRLHVNGDGTNPAVRVDNTGVVLAASVGSNGRTFYGWLPISVDGTTRWIRIFS